MRAFLFIKRILLSHSVLQCVRRCFLPMLVRLHPERMTDRMTQLSNSSVGLCLILFVAFLIMADTLPSGVETLAVSPRLFANEVSRFSLAMSHNLDVPTQTVATTSEDTVFRLHPPSQLLQEPEVGRGGLRLVSPAFRTWRFVKQLGDNTTIYPPPSLEQYLRNEYPLCVVHAQQILQLWNLIRTKGSMRHLNETDSQLMIEALSITYVALREKHTAQHLEDSINRAAGIAAVLGELRADWSVVIAGILHEVITDVSASPELLSQLSSRFGEDPIQLALSYSTLPRFLAKRTKYTDVQGENQIQMLVMLAEDYRSLYIRLADRLHTLRVLRKLPLDEAHRLQIAREARYVYAPLAHRMGVMKVRGELEDLAFRVLEPDMFLMTRYTQTAAAKAYQDAAERIEQFIHTDSILLSKGAKLRVSYRIKSKYQIYLKMLRKGLKSPHQVRDALGLRLIVDAPREENESDEQYAARKSALCYYVVERLRHMPGWEPAREGFKDYVMNVKENGYQSLHQYIRHLALGTSVEVQVRTREMHYTAELGEAAHWCYKDKIYRPEVAHSKLYRLAWRSPQQLSARSAAELFGLAKKQLLSSRVYVYLHDMSTVLNLKKGSTALDAAFAIHTAMGLSAKEVQVNGAAADLGHVLHTGDVVSVKCEEVPAAQALASVHPNKLTQVRTRCALSALRRYFKEHNQTMLLCIGLVKLLHALELNAPRLGLIIRGASHLANMVRARANMPIHEFLVNLGSATAQEDHERLLVAFFQTSAAHLVFASYEAAVQWAAGGGLARHQDDLVHPLLREILPESMSTESDALLVAETAQEIEKCWQEILREGVAQAHTTDAPGAPDTDDAGRKRSNSILRRPYSLQAASRSRPGGRSDRLGREPSPRSGAEVGVAA